MGETAPTKEPMPFKQSQVRPPRSKDNGRPSASSAAGQASSPSRAPGLDHAGRSADTLAGRVYLEAVLDLYLWLPGTPTRPSRHDRRLARTLYEGGIPLAVVKGALLLGTARRTFRPSDADPLPPIRTLHYFDPVIQELIEQPLVPGHADYLKTKLQALAEAKAVALR